jgi:hypothetical protein
MPAASNVPAAVAGFFSLHQHASNLPFFMPSAVLLPLFLFCGWWWGGCFPGVQLQLQDHVLEDYVSIASFDVLLTVLHLSIMFC